jgi:cell division protein FtsN
MHEFHEEDEEYFCRFTFGQFVSLALLEIVALFFVFYLGARYGPVMMGREPRPENEQIDISKEEVIETEKGSTGDIKYTFPEELTKKPEPPRPIEEPRREQIQAERRGGYSIQVGSYRKAGGAAAKVSQWQSKGYDAFLSIGEIANSGTWYRVRIGSFKNRESARKFLNRLTEQENVSAIIVRSNT